jgi:hypothetical protein
MDAKGREKSVTALPSDITIGVQIVIGGTPLLPVVSGYRSDLSRHASKRKRLGCYPEPLPLPLETGTGGIGAVAVPVTSSSQRIKLKVPVLVLLPAVPHTSLLLFYPVSQAASTNTSHRANAGGTTAGEPHTGPDLRSVHLLLFALAAATDVPSATTSVTDAMIRQVDQD